MDLSPTIDIRLEPRGKRERNGTSTSFTLEFVRSGAQRSDRGFRSQSLLVLEQFGPVGAKYLVVLVLVVSFVDRVRSRTKFDR